MFLPVLVEIGTNAVFPINDNNPTRITPYVTYALIAVNIVVFIMK
jgi:membrane associated rhomboid family serine protease